MKDSKNWEKKKFKSQSSSSFFSPRRSTRYPERVRATRKREETVAESNLLFWLWRPGVGGVRRGERDPSAPSPGRPRLPRASGQQPEPETRAGPGRGKHPPRRARGQQPPDRLRSPRSAADQLRPAGPRLPAPPRPPGTRAPAPGGREGGSGKARRAGGPGSPRVSPSARAPRCGTSPRLLPSRREGIPGDGPPGVAPPPGAPLAQNRQSGDRPSRREGALRAAAAAAAAAAAGEGCCFPHTGGAAEAAAAILNPSDSHIHTAPPRRTAQAPPPHPSSGSPLHPPLPFKPPYALTALPGARERARVTLLYADTPPARARADASASKRPRPATPTRLPAPPRVGCWPSRRPAAPTPRGLPSRARAGPLLAPARRPRFLLRARSPPPTRPRSNTHTHTYTSPL